MINRRSFIGGCGAMMLASRAGASSKARFELGIGTYTYRDVSVDEMARDLSALKIRQIELSSPQWFLPAVKLDTIAPLRSKLKAAGVELVSYFCGDIKSEADVELTLQAAAALGVRHVSGAAPIGVLKMVDSRFTREGFKFGIHNHWFRGRRFEYQSPEDVLRALATVSDTVGSTMDAGHMASCGYDPVDALKKLWPRLQLVHLKDVERVNDDKNVVLGTGIAKSAAVIDFLKRRRFAGLVAIEYEASPQNPQPDVARCVEFARRSM